MCVCCGSKSERLKVFGEQRPLEKRGSQRGNLRSPESGRSKSEECAVSRRATNAIISTTSDAIRPQTFSVVSHPDDSGVRTAVDEAATITRSVSSHLHQKLNQIYGVVHVTRFKLSVTLPAGIMELNQLDSSVAITRRMGLAT